MKVRKQNELTNINNQSCKSTIYFNLKAESRIITSTVKLEVKHQHNQSQEISQTTRKRQE